MLKTLLRTVLLSPYPLLGSISRSVRIIVTPARMASCVQDPDLTLLLFRP